MPKDLFVSIMCDDLFARNWMSLLIVRDWRTRLTAELNCHQDPYAHFAQNNIPCDLLVVDLDSLPSNPGLISMLNAQVINKKPIKILGISSRPERRFLARIKPELLAGYLLKDEIGTSLGWSIAFIADEKPVYTPTTYQLAFDLGLKIPDDKVILKRRVHAGITARQKEIARMAVIYSIGRRDLADELQISDQWSYGMVSELYEKLGLADLASNDESSLLFLQDDPKITKKLGKIIEDLGDGKKARDLETLAFHLLTMPVIED